jgi:hypothetical protein
MSPRTEIPYIEIHLLLDMGSDPAHVRGRARKAGVKSGVGVASGVKTGAASGVAWRTMPPLCSYSTCSVAQEALQWAFGKPVSP